MTNRFLKFDIVVALAVTITLIFLAYFLFGNLVMNGWITRNIGHVSEIVAGIAGTLLGFVIVGVTLVFGLLDRPRLQILRDSNQSKTVYDIYLTTIVWLSMVIVFSLVEVAIGSSVKLQVEGFTLGSVVSYILLFTMLASVTRLWRCVWVIKNLSENMIEQTRTSQIAP